MSDLIKIAVDAMGGDGSPKKIVDGIILNNKSNKNIFYKIFGDQNQISKLIENKILCIYGENSDYVKEEYFKNFKNYFSNVSFQKIRDSGHFLHVEKAIDFYEISSNFFKN